MGFIRLVPLLIVCVPVLALSAVIYWSLVRWLGPDLPSGGISQALLVVGSAVLGLLTAGASLLITLCAYVAGSRALQKLVQFPRGISRPEARSGETMAESKKKV